MLRDKGVLTEYRPGLYNIDEATRQYINFLRKKNPEAEEKVDYNTERAKLVMSEEGSTGTGIANEEKLKYTRQKMWSKLCLIC